MNESKKINIFTLLILLLAPFSLLSMEENTEEFDSEAQGQQINFSNLPLEIQSQVLSLVINDKQLEKLNSFMAYTNRRIFSDILQQWGLLRLVSKSISNLALYNLNRMINFCVQNNRDFCMMLLEKAAKYGNIDLFELIMKAGFKFKLLEVQFIFLPISSQHNHNQFSKKLIEFLEIEKWSEDIKYLIPAIYLHDYDLVKEWVESQGNDKVNQKMQIYVILEHAIASGNIEIASLIAEIVDLKSSLIDLGSAANFGLIDMMKLLIDKGVDVNRFSISGETPLALAVRNGHKKAVEFLIAHGAQVNKRNNVLGDTPLVLACAHGMTEIVQLLLASNADVYYVNSKGETALSCAELLNFTDIVALLKEHMVKFPHGAISPERDCILS